MKNFKMAHIQKQILKKKKKTELKNKKTNIVHLDRILVLMRSHVL